jgi:hypothetical protein
MLKYEAHRYDDFLHLKISPLLWLILLYGIRHPLFVAAAHLMPGDVWGVPIVSLQADPRLTLADIPAALALLSTGHRIKDAKAIMVWIWHHGAGLLLLSYFSSASTFAFIHRDLLENPSGSGFLEACIVLAIDVLTMVYLLRSELVKDIFADFPRG